MNDGLGPFTTFMGVFETLERADRHFLPAERDAVLGLAQLRFLQCSADPRLVEIVNRLCTRTDDAPQKASPKGTKPGQDGPGKAQGPGKR